MLLLVGVFLDFIFGDLDPDEVVAVGFFKPLRSLASGRAIPFSPSLDPFLAGAEGGPVFLDDGGFGLAAACPAASSGVFSFILANPDV